MSCEQFNAGNFNGRTFRSQAVDQPPRCIDKYAFRFRHYASRRLYKCDIHQIRKRTRDLGVVG